MDQGPGEPRTRVLVVLFAAIVRSPETGAEAIEEAHRRGIVATEVLEMVLQSYLFAGFPRCINALAAFREVYGHDLGTGAARTSSAEDLTERRHRGEELFRRIYGENSERVLDDLDRYHQDLREWILVDAYGKVLARPMLSARLRELAAVAALIVSGDTRQLSSHMRGAVHCGARPAEVRDAVTLAAPFAEDSCLERARSVVERLFPK